MTDGNTKLDVSELGIAEPPEKFEVLSLYTLNDKHEPVQERNPREWETWWRNLKNRQVAHDTFRGNGYVSTIFLGIDHGFFGTPMWFETMIFGVSEFDSYQERYTTWAEAVLGHARACELVKNYQRRRLTFNAGIPRSERNRKMRRAARFA